MTDPTGLTTFSYDPVGRSTGRSHPFGSQTQERDALGRVRRQELTVPASAVLTNPFETLYEYDEEGRLLWMRDRRGKTVELRYDALGRLTWLNHGQTTCDGGASTQTFGPSTSWTYDDRDRIESVVHRGPRPSSFVLGPILVSRTYERNAAGEPETITHQDGSATEVDYDPAGRVEAERYFDALGGLTEEVTYLYDLDGNRKKKTSSAGVEDYLYDSGSRLMQVLLDGVETQRFEYDDNGRVSRIVRDGLDQTLSWDALDRLIRVEDTTLTEQPVDFLYDGQGRRIEANRLGAAHRYLVAPTGNQGLESPHIVHDGALVWGELVYGGEHALWRYNGSQPPETRVYLRDAMGSVIGLMDENGQLVEEFEYDAFGNVRSAGGEALPSNIGGDSRFQGMWKDAGTGLYYVRARHYDPRTGRFLSRDPAEGRLETPESFYPYVFANGNPYLFRDPTGNQSITEQAVALVVRGVQASLSFASNAFRAIRQFRALRSAGLRRFGIGLNLARLTLVASDNASTAADAIPRITPGALPPDEEAVVLETLGLIDSSTPPPNKLKRNWGEKFENWAGDLPGGQGESSSYRSYRVRPPPGTQGGGTRRIVVDEQTGAVYYTWTHYGESGRPAFVRIR